MFNILNREISKVSFKNTLNKAGIPIVTLKHKNLKFNFIVDTGATTSLINDSTLHLIEDKEPVDGKDLILGLDPTIEYKADKYIIPIKLNTVTFKVLFRAMDLNATFQSLEEETGVSVDGLLGSDFLKENKCILDYDRMILYHKL